MGRSLILSTVTLLTAAQNPSSNAFLAFTKNDPLAVCLDGSPAAYYYRPGAESKKFYIHTQGGGYETSNDAFYARSLTDLGSSKNYPAVSAQVGAVGSLFQSVTVTTRHSFRLRQHSLFS